VVVLPFANLSRDPEQQYLADAITDDITTDLSRIADMVVISRNTAFTYRDKPVETKQLGRDLNVRYVLQGSVRRSGDRVRVNTQLIDAESDAHLWAERFDYATDDLFELQDDLTSRIAVALNLGLIETEAARPTDNPDALDYIFRGRATLYHSGGSTPQRFAEAARLFECALKLDPTAVGAKIFLAHALVLRVLEQMTDTPGADLERAEQLIEEARISHRLQSLAHLGKAHLLRAQNRHDAAMPEYQAALGLDRNLVLALAGLGQCKLRAGFLDEALAAQEQAIRLSPRDPYIANRYWSIGMVHLLKARTDEAIVWLERARSANPRLSGPHAWLASAYALVDDIESARTELGQARQLSGDDRYSSIVRFKSLRLLGSPRTHELAETTFFAGLRKAGVPEE
jgi:adenylate cyclase